MRERDMTVTKWPVAELHVHIEGTLETELLVTLARRNNVELPSYDPDALRELYRFTDLQSFLDIYYANLAVLRTESDFYDLGMAYLTRASAAGVRRAEIFFDPQTHLANGIPLAVVFGGLTRALTEARDSLFGALAASGWHTAAMTMRMLVDGELKLARGVIGAGGEISWPRPTRPGDTLRVESEILEITPSRSKPDRGMVKVRTRTLNQHDEVVQDFTATLIAWRRPA